MRLLLDAQLPVRLVALLQSLSHDVVHTQALPRGNRSTDEEVVLFADTDQRIVVTKDHDFLDSHLLSGRPQRLLLVSTGNITNDELQQLFVNGSAQLAIAFESSTLVELSRDAIIIHG